MLYQNKDTNDLKTVTEMLDLYKELRAEGITDDYGFIDWLQGVTDTNGLYQKTGKDFPVYYDTEHDEIVHEDDLIEEYNYLIKNRDTTQRFIDYLRNCLDKNGTLVKV